MERFRLYGAIKKRDVHELDIVWGAIKQDMQAPAVSVYRFLREKRAPGCNWHAKLTCKTLSNKMRVVAIMFPVED
jgi:hypothetical protein